jgi:hypothetical protein
MAQIVQPRPTRRRNEPSGVGVGVGAWIGTWLLVADPCAASASAARATRLGSAPHRSRQPASRRSAVIRGEPSVPRCSANRRPGSILDYCWRACFDPFAVLLGQDRPADD